MSKEEMLPFIINFAIPKKREYPQTLVSQHIKKDK